MLPPHRNAQPPPTTVPLTAPAGPSRNTRAGVVAPTLIERLLDTDVCARSSVTRTASWWGPAASSEFFRLNPYPVAFPSFPTPRSSDLATSARLPPPVTVTVLGVPSIS